MLPALYAVGLLVSAALLFAVQPLVGRLLTPLLGGTPAVWATCLVFFQAVLLLGYLYAHWTAAVLGVRRQAALHLLLLALPLVALPIALPPGHAPPDPGNEQPIPWLLVTLLALVGLPFFVVSTSGPLLQRWFAGTGHPAARDPYFLYAASNLGSLLALVGYPFLIEPRWRLDEQARYWQFGYWLFAALVVLCALALWRRGVEVTSIEEEVPAPLTRGRRLRWVALAAVPSSLLVGVSTHVATDIAPIPLLWLVPLTLYLLSFILVFARWPAALHRRLARLLPLLVLFLTVVLLTGAAEPAAAVLGLHLTAFFVAALVAHGELARDRPAARQLTAFYLAMSLGGVLGGLLNALLMPLLARHVGTVEYPAVLILACLIRPELPAQRWAWRWGDLLWPAALGGLTAALILAVRRFVPTSEALDTVSVLKNAGMYALPAVLAFTLIERPVRFALGLAALLLAGQLDPGPHGETLATERNFFGVVRATRDPSGTFVRLVHGTTIHGQQRVGSNEPLSYYHRTGPMGKLFAAYERQGKVPRVGAVGLGAGALAAYGKPGQAITFYEIDPAVLRLARDSGHFTFLRDSPATIDYVLGDARLQLARETRTFDLLIVDAFSSDAIPVHLLTAEALAVYLARLAPGGVLAFHLSNRFLDLPPLVGRLAAAHDPPLAAKSGDDRFPSAADKAAGKSPSQWVALARTPAELDALTGGTWFPVEIPPGTPLWTDDFSNLLSAWRREE